MGARIVLLLILLAGPGCEYSGNVGTSPTGAGDGAGAQCYQSSCQTPTATKCACAWKCTDGKAYGLECELQGATQHCRCKVDGTYDSQTCANPTTLNICTVDRCCKTYPKP